MRRDVGWGPLTSLALAAGVYLYVNTTSGELGQEALLDSPVFNPPPRCHRNESSKYYNSCEVSGGRGGHRQPISHPPPSPGSPTAHRASRHRHRAEQSRALAQIGRTSELCLCVNTARVCVARLGVGMRGRVSPTRVCLDMRECRRGHQQGGTRRSRPVQYLGIEL